MNKKQQLFEEADIINKSINWWYKEMAKIMRKMDRAKDMETAVKLNKQLSALMAKGELEIQNMDKWIDKSKLK